jgi:hypothetical protein
MSLAEDAQTTTIDDGLTIETYLARYELAHKIAMMVKTGRPRRIGERTVWRFAPSPLLVAVQEKRGVNTLAAMILHILAEAVPGLSVSMSINGTTGQYDGIIMRMHDPSRDIMYR